jgi:uncharacterized protein with HEPN domain
MLEAAEQVQRFARGGRSRYNEDAMMRSAIERQLEIMGEAARRLSQTYREEHPEVPWRQVIGMRNVLIHGYDDLDEELVWNAIGITLNETIPALRRLLA